MENEICCWTMDEHYDLEYWESECGDMFGFEESGPIKNNFKFCPFCGKKIIEVIANGITQTTD